MILGLWMVSAAWAGNAVAPVELRDHHGQPHRVPDIEKAPFTVVAFLGVECPLAKQYAVRLVELQKEYAGKGSPLSPSTPMCKTLSRRWAHSLRPTAHLSVRARSRWEAG